MYLLIDLSLKNIVHLALFDQKNIIERVYHGRNKNLLTCIGSLLKKQKISRQSIKGIMAVVGTGGFTSTRIATVVANTFAYTLRIPVLAVEVSQLKKIQELIPELLKQPIGQYISATYSGLPNITTTKN